MDIDYTINNVTCNGDDNGSISIDTVTLTSGEFNLYGLNYTIDWTDNIPSENIITNNFVAISLPADTYGFRIFGNSNYSAWTYVDVTEPDELSINSITKSHNPCENNSSITVNVTGGTPPYTATYDVLSVTSSGNSILFSGLNINYSSIISVTDANNCSVNSDSTIDIEFSSPSVSFLDQSPPRIYDDHLESFTFSITGAGPFKIIIWNSENGIKQSVYNTIDFFNTSYITSITDNIFSYNIGSLLFPGSYIFDIFDSNNCSITSSEVNAINSNPLSVNIVSTNNNPIDNSFYVTTSTIFDTLLIPYNLLVNNNTILDFIKALNNNDKILLQLNDVEYLQKVIKFNKNKSNYNNNYIDILQLGPTQDLWFFSIQISIGFDYSTITNIFTDNLYLVYNNEQFIVVPELNNDSSSIKLIRGSILSPSFNTAQFSKNSKIGLYNLENNIYNFLYELDYAQKDTLYNTYSVGSILCLNILDHPMLVSNFDISTPSFSASLDKLSYQQKIYSSLEYLNNTTKTILCAATQNFQHNGSINMLISGGYITSNYNISYKYWNESTNTLENIYFNNNILTDSRAFGLKEGIYILRITDIYNNKIKTVNSISYDTHYAEAINYINNVLNTTTTNIDFVYGDLLIPIFRYSVSSSTIQNNIIGTEPDEVIDPPEPIDLFPDIIDINVTTNTSYNNNLLININPNNILCNISGPNGYYKIFSNGTRFNNLPPGVYYINGESSYLSSNYLFNNPTTIYVTNNLEENVNIIFNSYLNQYILGS